MNRHCLIPAGYAHKTDQMAMFNKHMGVRRPAPPYLGFPGRCVSHQPVTQYQSATSSLVATLSTQYTRKGVGISIAKHCNGKMGGR